jgi:GNAT superfamily N-acetyltransferase
MCGLRREILRRIRHRAEVGPFFVTKVHQAKGAAQALMQGVIDEARACGIEQLELYVDAQNVRAWTFYEKWASNEWLSALTAFGSWAAAR